MFGITKINAGLKSQKATNLILLAIAILLFLGVIKYFTGNKPILFVKNYTEKNTHSPYLCSKERIIHAYMPDITQCQSINIFGNKQRLNIAGNEKLCDAEGNPIYQDAQKITDENVEYPILYKVGLVILGNELFSFQNKQSDIPIDCTKI